MCPSASTTGIATRSVGLGEHTAHRFLFLVLLQRYQPGLHGVAHLALAAGREQLSQRDHPEQHLLLVQHVGIRKRAQALPRQLAQVADRLVDGHVRADARVARVHQAARFVLGIRQQRVDFVPGALVEQPQ
jgi:hypothetical protein